MAGVTASTALERVLSTDGYRRRPTPIDALKAARRGWLRGENLDMGRLAEELGTSRATLYRWVGDKDRLVTEVLWSLAADTLAQARTHATSSGPDFVADTLDWFMTAITFHPSMRKFLERDPEYALRILTGQHSVIQARMSEAVGELVAEQERAGALVPPLASDALSYLIVRIIESFMYSDLITGAEPDISNATTAIRILLHAQPVPAKQPSPMIPSLPARRPPGGRTARRGESPRRRRQG